MTILNNTIHLTFDELKLIIEKNCHEITDISQRAITEFLGSEEFKEHLNWCKDGDNQDFINGMIHGLAWGSILSTVTMNQYTNKTAHDLTFIK